MFKLIGTPYCARCENLKRKFEEQDIDFDYELIGDLPLDLQEEIKELALTAGLQQFPIILDITYKAIFTEEEIL